MDLHELKNIVKKHPLYGKNKMEVYSLPEKIKWLNVNNLSDLKIRCTDKIGVKEYVKKTLGVNVTPKTLQIYDSYNEIDFNTLPNKFIIKANNGCGKNIFVYDKTNYNLSEIKNTCKKWLELIPGISSSEFQYAGVQPKIFTEELLINSKSESLVDYRFWCFNGSVQFIAVNDDHGWGGQYFVDKNFQELNLINGVHYDKRAHFDKPLNFHVMIDYATKLSYNFKFVRVDMYNINGRIYIGELTFSPGGYLFQLKTKTGDDLNNDYGKLLVL